MAPISVATVSSPLPSGLSMSCPAADEGYSCGNVCSIVFVLPGRMCRLWRRSVSRG